MAVDGAPVNAREQQRRINLLEKANVPLLAELGKDELRKVAKEARMDCYRPGTKIIDNGVHVGHEPGEKVTPIYIVDKGNPMAFIDGMGRVKQYEADDYFGELGAIDAGLQRLHHNDPPASAMRATVMVSEAGLEVWCLVIETATVERVVGFFSEQELEELRMEISVAYSHATVMKRDAGLRQVIDNLWGLMVNESVRMEKITTTRSAGEMDAFIAAQQQLVRAMAIANLSSPCSLLWHANHYHLAWVVPVIAQAARLTACAVLARRRVCGSAWSRALVTRPSIFGSRKY